MQAEQNEMQQQIAQMQTQDKEDDSTMKQYEIDANNEVKLLVAEMQGESKGMDLNRDGIADILEGDIKERELDIREKTEEAKISLENRKIESQKEIQRMKDRAALERERVKSVSRPTTTTTTSKNKK
jgi:hypothetical protein